MIKLAFCDMPLSFNKTDNFVLNILKKYALKFELSDHPDFVFYSCYGSAHTSFHHCVKIFWSVEPVCPNFNECDYAVSFDDISFERRYCRRPYWIFNKMPDINQIDDESALNRKFCNFIYSNDKNGEGAELRKRFARKLMEYKNIDCPGKVLNNMQNAISPREGDWKKGKLEFISNYKFTIAFENTKYNNYTTEKLLDPLSVGSIPIYWGNPYVTRDFNEKSFVLCNTDNLDSVIERIIQLDQNDGLYLQMLHEPLMTSEYNVNEVEELEVFLTEIFKRGNIPFNKDPLGYNEKMQKKKSGFWKTLLVR